MEQVGTCNMAEQEFSRINLPEVDSALLMELLEDSPTDLAEDDRLNNVIQSLEAEIGCDRGPMAIGNGESTAGPNGSDDGGLEDMLSDFDSYDGSSPVAGITDGPFDWPEMGVGPSALGHDDMGVSYMDGEGSEGVMFGYGEPREYYAAAYSYCGEPSMEQVYSPLWE